MSTDQLLKSNQPIWLKMKLPQGREQYVPRIIDISADQSQQPSEKPRPKKCLWWILIPIMILLIIGLLLALILIPILLAKSESTTTMTTNITTTTNVILTTLTTAVTCIYPNVATEFNRCVNILIDSNNCGRVGNVCPNNSTCSAGQCQQVPGILLDQPNTIWSSAVNGSSDDQMFNVILPWNISAYNSTTNRVTVTTDGVLCFADCATSYIESRLPSRTFSGVTLFPFWDDLYIYGNTSQGIYYQSHGSSPNRTLSFEYYMSHYIETNQFYHFQVEFFERFPGIVQFKYFDATDGGDTSTIGIQSSSTGPFMMYSYDQPDSVQRNMILTFNTNTATFNKSIMAEK